MPELSDNLHLNLTVGEFNDIVTHLQRSVTWTQQTLSKLIMQAKEQTAKPAEPATPAPPAETPAPRANGGDTAVVAPVRPRRAS